MISLKCHNTMTADMCLKLPGEGYDISETSSSPQSPRVPFDIIFQASPCSCAHLQFSNLGAGPGFVLLSSVLLWCLLCCKVFPHYSVQDKATLYAYKLTS